MDAPPPRGDTLRPMEVVSICPLRAASVLWESAPYARTLTVVAKATYSLRPVESPLATAQEAPTEIDEHWNDDEQRSLHAPSDLAPFKRRADVILVGHAFAPGAIPVRSLVARLVVGEVDKSIEVFGERAFTIDAKLLEGAPFVKAPIRWERAAGGPDTLNPVGIRVDTLHSPMLPSLQPPGLHVTSPADYVAPVCFGPIAATWPTRLAKLSVSAAGWDFRRWSDQRLPHDLDPAFFNVAPSDQQLDVIRPNERIVLENLHPEHPRLVTSLVSATPRAVVEGANGTSEEFGMRCDTLLIDTDRGTCSLTWRGQIPIDDPQRAARVIITMTQMAGRPEETARARRNLGTIEMQPPKPPEATLDETIDGTSSSTLPPLPFRVGRSALAGMVLGVPAAAPALEAPASVPDLSFSETTDEHTSPQAPIAPREALPFVAQRTDLDDEEETHTDLPRDLAQLVASTVSPIAAPIVEETTADIPAARAAMADPAPPATPAEPPPMIGPLATPEMLAPAPAKPVDEEAPAKPEPEPAKEPEPPPLPLDAYPLERCAAIAASIARTKDRTRGILAEHELAPDLWQRLDRHWIDHVRQSSGRGKTAPLKAYDAAYVGQLEKERGPIKTEEYADLVVAMERGSAEEALSTLDLPRGALLRVQRVWLERTSRNQDLGKAVRHAVEAARDA